jgi:carboxymethylenebutenolidase
MKRRDVLRTAAGLSTTAIAIGLGQAESSAAPSPAKKPQIVTKSVNFEAGLGGYYAAPAGNGPFPAIVLLMEAFGLNAYIKDVANRMAQAGYVTVVPDFFRGEVFPYTDVPRAVAKLKTLKDDAFVADFGAALGFLAKQKEVQVGGVGVMGFCMGGRHAFLASIAYAAKIRGAVCFYGGGIAPQQSPNPLGQVELVSRAAAIQAPIMLMYGSEDSLIAADEHVRVASALSAAKKRYSINVFPRAQHGFLSDRRENYEPNAAKESWEMTLAFFRRHLRNP